MVRRHARPTHVNTSNTRNEKNCGRSLRVWQPIQPIQWVNVDFASTMLDELDNAAKELNISRQAVIKALIRQATLIRQALDQHYLATARQSAAKRE